MENEMSHNLLDVELEMPPTGSVDNNELHTQNTHVLEEEMLEHEVFIQQESSEVVRPTCTCELMKGSVKRIEGLVQEMAHTQQILLKKVIHIEYLMPLTYPLDCFSSLEKMNPKGGSVSNINTTELNPERARNTDVLTPNSTGKEKIQTIVQEAEKEGRLVHVLDDEDVDCHALAQIKHRLSASLAPKKNDNEGAQVTHFAQTEREKVYGKIEKQDYIPQTLKYRRAPVDRAADGSQNARIANLVRQLSFTNTGEGSTFKRPMEEPVTKLTPRKRVNSSTYTSTETSTKEKGGSSDYKSDARKANDKGAPKVIRTSFRPTKDMNLTQEQAKLSAYVFYYNNDPSEVIFKCRGFVGTMKDFGTLSPNKTIESEIITMMATKTMATQEKLSNPSVWSFPPSFHQDINRGMNMDDLMNKYVNLWMPQYYDLKYIYVPIKECGGHWYLTVISIQEKVVYHLDSLLDPKNVNPRRYHIGKVCETLAATLQSKHFPLEFGNGLACVDNWEVTDAPGLGNCGTWSNSAVWILDWMKMEDTFQPNMIGAMNEKIVRMKIAIDLLSGEHNECWETLQAKVQTFWRLAT
ncbi:Ulp1 protease family, C-terminal catalytic domain [Sesbania bispinosa]|nr:Ulp1 protease family, C-terminal catalytic domain [Sesbania bispinosa]